MPSGKQFAAPFTSSTFSLTSTMSTTISTTTPSATATTPSFLKPTSVVAAAANNHRSTSPSSTSSGSSTRTLCLGAFCRPMAWPSGQQFRTKTTAAPSVVAGASEDVDVTQFWSSIRFDRTGSDLAKSTFSDDDSTPEDSSNLTTTSTAAATTTTSRKRSRSSRRRMSTQPYTMRNAQPYDPENITKLLVNDRHVDDVYELGEEIGAGAFGWVIAATHRASGNVRAMKAQSIRDNKWCFRELEMASRVEHPNCAKAIDAFIHKDKLLIVSELYTGSDLYDYIVEDNREAFTEYHAYELCLQMLSALEACHRAGFAHLDVKPENFMFKYAEPGSPLVLVDYGSAEPFENAKYAETSEAYIPERDDVLTTLSRITGTACYMSPEVARGNFSSRSDVWSAAICLYILMALEPPFEMTLKPRMSTDNVDSGIPNVDEPRYHQSPNLAHPGILTMTDHGKQLMCSMMHHDPALRLSATEALAAIRKHLAALEEAGLK